MTYYEIVSTIISILSFGATIFFGIAVLKLSKKANEIAEESVRIQQETFAAQVTQIETNVKEQYSDKNTEIIDKFTKNEKELKKNSTTYNEGMNQVKANEYKKWKVKNDLAKKQFLQQKK